MLILNRDDMKNIFTMRDAIDADKEALRIFSQGKSVVPLRTNINVPKYEGQCLFMPGYVEELDTAGAKIVSVFPHNIEKGKTSVPSKMILISGETGEVCAMMDGTYLTQLRTGALAGAATEIIAREDAKIGAVFGTGGQGAGQLEAMLAARKLELVKVFDINYERAKEFAARMQSELENYGARIQAVKSSDEAVEDADIITTATTSKKPVFDGRKVKEGAHINAIGAYTPQMQEIDEYIVKRADKIYLDSKDAVLSEAGDMIIPIEKGIIGKDKITGELGEVILKKVVGRENDKEITIFDTVGIAVLDVVTAHMIYKKALGLGIGTEIEF